MESFVLVSTVGQRFSLLLPVLTLTLLTAPPTSTASSTLALSLPLRSTLTLTLTLALRLTLTLALSPLTLANLRSTRLSTGTTNTSQAHFASILLLLSAFNNDLLVSTTLSGDLDSTLTAVLDLERSDNSSSSGLDLLVFDESAGLGLYEVNLVDLSVFAQDARQDGIRDRRRRILLLPVVELEESKR
jgi:hypothetical protein